MKFSGKDIHDVEQSFTAMAKHLVPGLWSMYKAALEEGFTPEQAMKIVLMQFSSILNAVPKDKDSK